MTAQNTQSDFFEFYELPVQFHPDLNAIKSKFYANSKKFHPDFYANESEEKQQEVLELSTLNNKAYQTLSHPQKRLKYVLELNGVVATDEGYQLPQSFLMEMMDINEALMDLEFDPDAEKQAQVESDINGIDQQLQDKMNMLTAAFDADPESASSAFPEMKDIFYRQKYIARIRERLAK